MLTTSSLVSYFEAVIFCMHVSLSQTVLWRLSLSLNTVLLYACSSLPQHPGMEILKWKSLAKVLWTPHCWMLILKTTITCSFCICFRSHLEGFHTAQVTLSEFGACLFLRAPPHTGTSWENTDSATSRGWTWTYVMSYHMHYQLQSIAWVNC